MQASTGNTQQQDDMGGKTNGELMIRHYNATKVEHDEESAAAAQAELNGRNFWNTETNPRCNPNWVYLGH